MQGASLRQRGPCQWEMEPGGRMRVPVVVHAARDMIDAMDPEVFIQARAVAALPGAVDACHLMPDAMPGSGFPAGAVAAFDPREGGVVLGGGAGFDISGGVRCLQTGLRREQVLPLRRELEAALASGVPAGDAGCGAIVLDDRQMHDVLAEGARWAVEREWGLPQDLERVQSRGCLPQARPGFVPEAAKRRHRAQLGTLGNGRHCLEVQEVDAVFEERLAGIFGLRRGDVVVSIHCGSRGLGNQISAEYLRRMSEAAPGWGLHGAQPVLACVAPQSELGQQYMGAMRAAVNCALANRQILTHLVRLAFARVCPKANMPVLYDVSHNSSAMEEHVVDGVARELYVHRKGATRVFGPGHPQVPEPLRAAGQPVVQAVAGGQAAYVLAGLAGGQALALASASHGAGLSLEPAREVGAGLRRLEAVADVTQQAALACKVARLRTLFCVKA